MNVSEIVATPTSPDPETGVLAREVANAFRVRLAFYKETYKLSHEQALERMGEDNPEYVEQLLKTPPDQLSWLELEQVGRSSQEKALTPWEHVKEAAREELRSGHRMASVIELPNSRCWPRAQFLALREELLEGWKPANAMERQLVEPLAQAQAAYLHWLETLTTWTGLEHEEDQGQRDDGTWRAPRICKAEGIEQASGMVDRFHRIMMRTLRTLRDLRRHSRPVIVQNAGQVNVAEQEINVHQGSG